MNRNIVRATMTDQAYDIIRDRIVSGVYKSDEKLTEQGLAKNLELSPTPVREAFNRLVSEGFLVSIPYKGVFVKSYSIKDIEDAYRVRARLQSLVVDMMMETIRDEEIAELEKIFERDINDTEKNVFIRIRYFQEYMFTIVQSDVIESSLAPINAVINIDRVLKLKSEPNVEMIEGYFGQLMDNIKNRNKEMACKQMEAIVHEIMSFVLIHYDEFMN